MGENHQEEAIGEGLMDSLRLCARSVADRERRRALLVDAAQCDNARDDIERQDCEEGEHHQAAKRVVSEVSRPPTSRKAGQVGGHRGWRDRKAGESRISRPHEAPKDAENDQTCDRHARADVNIKAAAR